METVKLDSKRNLSKKPVFACECRADSHRDTITEAPICPHPQPYTVGAYTNMICGAGVISQPCQNPKAVHARTKHQAIVISTQWVLGNNPCCPNRFSPGYLRTHEATKDNLWYQTPPSPTTTTPPP